MRDDNSYLPRLSRALLLGAALGLPCAASAAGIDKQDFNQIERGHYLAIVGDCAACHTLPGSGHDFAGGRVIETPFGNLVAPNITPDPVTGIGAWTDDEFVDALTKGTGRHGERLYPAMPYTYYTKLRPDDALAIRAYLDTVPAVYNPVKADQLPFPLNLRASMGVWDRLFFKAAPFEPDHNKSTQWNRGAYLTEGLGHCGLCHTPKNVLGADKTSEALQGYALQGWFAPNITNDPRRGLGSWSVEDIAAYLKTGHNKTTAGNGLMSETINLSTSKMSDDDLKAERGPWRDTATDFPISYMQDELRYRIQHELFLRNSQMSVTFRNNANETALPVRSWGAFMLGNGAGGAGVHWNAETWRFLPTDFTLKSYLTQRYGANFLPADMTIQDWGVSFDDLEPHYDAFEYLCGTSGRAGNLNGQIQEGGNPFEGSRSRPYPTPPQKQGYGHMLFAKAAQQLGYKPFPHRPAICRKPTPIRSASRWDNAPIAGFANGSVAPIIPRRARRPPCCRCCCGNRISRRARTAK